MTHPIPEADAPPAELPPMWSAELDHAGVNALFADLAEVRLVAVSVRGNRARTAGDPELMPLSDARALLAAGHGIQVRYRFDDGAGEEEWWDTLIPGRDSTRLVRIRHPL